MVLLGEAMNASFEGHQKAVARDGHIVHHGAGRGAWYWLV